MSFSEQFIHFAANTTIYRLSKQTGIERTKLQRIKSGQKLPTREELEKICFSLSLVPAEKHILKKELEIALIGETRYKCRKCTANFIEELYCIFEKECLPIRANIQTKLDVSCPAVTEGSLQTSRAVSAVLLEEVSNGARVKIFGSFDGSEILFDEILRSISDAPGLRVTHIFPIKPNSGSYENYYSNIKIVGKIYPVFLSRTEYSAYCYYEKTGGSAFMPLEIITDNYLISISGDCANAVITRDKNVIKLHSRLFEQKIPDAYPLIENISNAVQYSTMYVDHLNDYNIKDTKLITIEYEPCLTPYFSDQLVEKCLRKNLPGYETVLERAKECFGTYRDLLLKTSFFTIKGFDSFLHTGRIAEIPEEIYDPIPPKDRIKIACELCQRAETGKIELHIINEDKLHIPRNLRYSGSGQSNDIFLLQSGSCDSVLKLNQCGFAAPFHDFAVGILDSGAALSNDESVKIIRKHIEDFRKHPAEPSSKTVDSKPNAKAVTRWAVCCALDAPHHRTVL